MDPFRHVSIWNSGSLRIAQLASLEAKHTFVRCSFVRAQHHSLTPVGVAVM